MRTLFIILGGIGAVLGLIMAFLPFDTIALLPAVAGIVFGFIALIVSKKKSLSTKAPNLIIALSFVASAVVAGKTMFTENKVAEDESFEQREEASEQEAVKELEEIQELEEIEQDSIQ